MGPTLADAWVLFLCMRGLLKPGRGDTKKVLRAKVAAASIPALADWYRLPVAPYVYRILFMAVPKSLAWGGRSTLSQVVGTEGASIRFSPETGGDLAFLRRVRIVACKPSPFVRYGGTRVLANTRQRSTPPLSYTPFLSRWATVRYQIAAWKVKLASCPKSLRQAYSLRP